MAKIVLIDGNAIIHRAFHAIKPLTTKSGEQVNAVYGFTSILMNILTSEEPKYIVCTFDAAKKTFRHEQYAEYKATRVKAPDELYEQIPRIHQIVDTLEIPKFIMEGYEADDLIGTISTLSEKEAEIERIIIATGDMDALQLITDKTCVNNLHKGYKDSTCFGPKDVFNKYGIWPTQVIDYKGLVGDTSDNIPGVMGIGEKTAVKLLKEFKNIEGIYEHINDISKKIQEKLLKDKEKAFFSRELATIKKDVPIKFNLKDCVAHEFNLENAIKLFEELQFYSIIRRITEWKKIDISNKEEPESDKKEQLSLF